VHCADTNQPCRYAGVILQSVNSAPNAQQPKDKETEAESSSYYSASTGLDGAFLIEDVIPGTYFAVAELPGYNSGIGVLSQEDLKTGSAEVKKELDSLLPKITVESGRVSSLELRLERGSFISGQVRYDDGSPGINLGIKLYRRDKKGAWKEAISDSSGPFHFLSFAQFTDDEGRFRIISLPAGEYVVEASLPIVTFSISALFGTPGVQIHPHDESALKVYSGDATRLRLAKPIVLGAGENRNDADIVIPLSGLHSLRGTVTAKIGGLPINHGKISLLDQDDKTYLRSAAIRDYGEFAFTNVPEGNYLIEIKNAEETESDKTVRLYQDLQQPLLVKGDVENISLSLTAQKPK